MGSANLSFQALSGAQGETFLVADGEPAWRHFHDVYTMNDGTADPIATHLLVVTGGSGAAPTLDVRDVPVALQSVPCFRFLEAKRVIVETPRPLLPELSAAALREASAVGAEHRGRGLAGLVARLLGR